MIACAYGLLVSVPLFGGPVFLTAGGLGFLVWRERNRPEFDEHHEFSFDQFDPVPAAA